MVREVCHAICEENVDEVMASPPHLKNRNNWQVVSERSGTFLNCVATIDGKHIANRKRDSSGSLYYLFFSAASYWLLSTQTTSSCNVTLV